MSGLFWNRRKVPQQPKTLAQQEQQILSGVRIQSSAYGLVIPIVYGWNRVSGNLLWYGDFYRKSQPIPQSGGGAPASPADQGGGGKGGLFGRGSGGGSGGEGAQPQYENVYFASFCMGLCEGPVYGIGKIWDSAGHLSVNYTQENYTVPSLGVFTVEHHDTFLYNMGASRLDTYSHVANDYGSPGAITLGGVQITPMTRIYTYPIPKGCYVNTGSNYQFSAQDEGEQMQINYAYAPENEDGSSGTPITMANLQLFKGYNEAYGLVEGRWPVWPNQTPWAYLGWAHATEQIGYTGISYVASQACSLGTSGQLPNLSFEIFGQMQFNGAIFDCNPRDVIVDLLCNPYHGAGWVIGTDIDVVADTNQYCNYVVSNGFFFSPIIDQQRAASDWIKDMLDASNSEAVWSGSRLKLIPYGDTTTVGNGLTYTPDTHPVYDLNDDDFLPEEGEDPLIITRPTVQDAYNSIQIEFLNRTNNYNQEIVEAKDQDSIEKFGLRARGVDNMHFIKDPLVAAGVAQNILARNCFVRNQYEFNTTGRYILVEPMDLLTLTDSSLGMDKVPVRVKEVSETEENTLHFICEEFPWGVAATTIYPKQLYAGTYLPGQSAQPGNVNPPIMFEAWSRFNNQIGHQIVMGLSGGDNWGGCNVYVSLDDVTYKRVGSFHGKSRMGELYSTFPVHPDPDIANNLVVDLTQSNGNIYSGTLEECDNLTTLCWVDGELISYQDAILVNTNIYAIGTRIRRGVLNSPITDHYAGSKFLRLDQNYFTYDFDPSLIGKTLFFKFTSFNLYGNMEQALSVVPTYGIEIIGTSMGLLMPAHISYRPVTNPLVGISSRTAMIIDTFVGSSLNNWWLVRNNSGFEVSGGLVRVISPDSFDFQWDAGYNYPDPDFPYGIASACVHDQIYPSDQWAQMIVQTTPTFSNAFGPTVRNSISDQTWYGVLFDAQNIILYKCVAGSITILQQIITWPSAPPVEVGDIVRIQVRENKLAVYINNVIFMRVQDTSIGSGYPGMAGLLWA